MKTRCTYAPYVQGIKYGVPVNDRQITPIFFPLNLNVENTRSGPLRGTVPCKLRAALGKSLPWVALFFFFAFVLWPLVLRAIEIEGGF